MKIKLNIPTSLSDIKLSQYQKFIRTTEGSEDENFICRQMVAIFCNTTDKIIDSMKAKDFDDLVNSITNVLSIKPVFVDRFKLDGVKYGFIPKFDDITLGEKIDIDEFYKDVKTMDKAMAVMFRPIELEKPGGYIIQEYNDKYINYNKGIDVTLDIAFGANVFFSTLTNDLLSYIQKYIKQEVDHNPKALQILEKNGGGTAVFMNSLEAIFSNLKHQQNLNYIWR